MLKLTINGKEHELEEEGQNLLKVCLTLGYDVPYFCWHPAMHSVGACRQCAVKQYRDEEDTHGRIVMACMTPATDGLIVSTDDPEVVAFRRSVVEWLMINHPHDCPVCDEGGECHLQDMTVMTGHNYRRHRFTKRTHRNQDLGPFINHEMNRCIQCYRCVRFYRDFAGGRDFEVFGWHDHVYFGRHKDGPLENEFSGNLVEICPTGVFTDKTLKRHYTRKWDLQTAPSVCVHCGLGCNTIPGERYGTLRCIRSRFNDKVNGYFLCDRGRFGYEFVNCPERLRQPMVRNEEGELEPCSVEEALRRATEMIREGKVIGIGSPRASLESNFAAWSLSDGARFCHGMSQRTYRLVEEVMGILQRGPARVASLQEVARDDAVLLLAEDITNTAPLLTLALRRTVIQAPAREAGKLKVHEYWDSEIREAIQVGRGPLYIATPNVTKLDDETPNTFRCAPPDAARLGFAVAHAIDPAAPEVPDLDDETREHAERCAAELLASENPVVIAGITAGHRGVVQAAANVAWALERRGKQTDVFYTLPECNTTGVALMGGMTLDAALEALRDGSADTLIIAENDLTQEMAVDLAHEMVGKAKHVICLDHLPNHITEHADVLLPAATFAEGSGTLVNNEGRGQRFMQVFAPEGEVRESWCWLGEVAVALGLGDRETWSTLDGVVAAMAKAHPNLARTPLIAPPANYRMIGQRIPRQSHRYSGRTAIHANLSVHEPKPPEDHDTPLAYSMEGFAGEPPPSLIPRFWGPGWNSQQAIGLYQTEVGGPLRGGGAGLRLVEPTPDSDVPYFDQIPEAFVPREDALLVMPDYLIFGSEPLSMHSEAVASRAPEPYVALSQADMERLGVKEGQVVALLVTGTAYHLPVVCRPALPRGVAMLPARLGDVTGLGLPDWGQVEISEEPWE